MDPTEALANLIEAAYAGDDIAVMHIGADLARWIRRGGFKPDIARAAEIARARVEPLPTIEPTQEITSNG